VRAAYSYQASNEPAVHVGLGSIDRVDSAHVRWPDGTEAVFEGLAADRTHTLRRP